MSFTMPALEPVLKVLRYRGRPELAALLANSSCEFDESTQYGSYLYSTLTTVEIRSSLREHDRLKALNDADTQAILDAFRELNPPQAHSIELCDIRFVLDPSTLEDDDTDEIVREIEAQRELMIAVATGGPRIPDRRRDVQSPSGPHPWTASASGLPGPQRVRIAVGLVREVEG